ncbi:MAG TPA: hypothetical protein VGA42_05735 [Gemmatimonadales bacterium]|jgi:hypothetical protein
MRRPVLLGALLGLACAESPLPLDELAPPPDFAAAAETVNFFEPVSLTVFVPCAAGGAGEDVVIEGFLHIQLSFTESSSGNLRVKEHVQPQGISGTGLVTGDRYQGTGVTQQWVNLGPGAGATLVNNFRMIGQGPGNNFLIHENVHIQLNANGVLTVFVDNFSVECR